MRLSKAPTNFGYLNESDKELSPAALVVKQYLQPDSDLGAFHADRKIHKVLPDIKPQDIEEGLSGALHKLYFTINDVARHTHYDDPLRIRLLELLLDMRGSEKTTAVYGWDIEGTMSYRDPLSAYGQNIRDHYGLNNTPEGRKQWINENAFYSRVHASGGTNLLLFFRWQMEDIFLHEARSKAPKSPDLDCNLAAAALWILNAGVGILQDLVACTGALKGAEGGDLQDGPSKGLHLDHWRLWRAGLGQYERDERVAGESRRLSKGAADLMDVLGRRYGIIESKDECYELSTFVYTPPSGLGEFMVSSKL